MNLALKILLWIIGAIVGLVVVIIAGLNIYVRIEYASFYEEAQKEFRIPGIDSGFIPQDLDYIEEDDVWLFSGYVSGDDPSPVYRLYPNGSSDSIILLMPDGSPYTGHGGGITSDDEHLFITIEDGYLAFDLVDVMNATEEQAPTALGFVDVGFSPAFLNIEDDAMYLGDYYYPGSYETPDEHHIQMPDGTLNQAVMYSYPSDGSGDFGYASSPAAVFSIPDSVQGFCLDSEGNYVLSASANIQPTLLYRFDSSAVLSEQLGTFNASGVEVPLYGLWEGNMLSILEGPPMGEGIESLDGLVYLAEESASNKYIFGKLYGAGDVYALPL